MSRISSLIVKGIRNPVAIDECSRESTPSSILIKDHTEIKQRVKVLTAQGHLGLQKPLQRQE